MLDIFKLSKVNIFFILFSVATYIGLTIYCFDNCYFWDVTQQVSKEAHWFYYNGFKALIIPSSSSDFEIMGTGYHPPLMGIITAFLWKLFGYNLWVSHVFTFLCSLILIYNLYKLVSYFFDVKYTGIVLFILIIDVTVLTQFSISSPDFIMLTAFVISLRAILFKNRWLLSFALIFLCCINIRGLFTAVILFISHSYYQYILNKRRYNFKQLIYTIIPYLPALFILLAYYTYYFLNVGWFFNNSSYSEHYILPDSLKYLYKHITTFILRLVENGRIFIWVLFSYIIFKIIRTKYILSSELKFFLINIILLYSLYFIFIFISKMPFSPRYFIPQFFLLSFFTLYFLTKLLDGRKVIILFSFVILFHVTGHFWIYNEKLSQAWDCKLSHLPYYKLRSECFKYIDEHNIDYDDISGGFCFAGNRLFSELNNKHNYIIGKDFNNKYFIHSNISNNEDEVIDELRDKNKWKEVVSFHRWPVYIVIYKNRQEINFNYGK